MSKKELCIYQGKQAKEKMTNCKKKFVRYKEGAEIFFAPDNPVSKEEKKANPKAKSNYETAKDAAKQIHSKMKIVPVKTLQDAIDYLKKK